MRELRAGSFRARRVGDAVVVTATGWSATSGHRVWLERGEGSPPELTLYAEPPDGPSLQVITPFSVEASLEATGPVAVVVVHDARGRHEVPVT